MRNNKIEPFYLLMLTNEASFYYNYRAFQVTKNIGYL